MSPSEILDIAERLDVPTLAVLVVLGFWKLHTAVTSSQRALVDSLRMIEQRLALTQAEVNLLSQQLDKHMANDREDFQRLYDQIRDLRRAG